MSPARCLFTSRSFLLKSDFIAARGESVLPDPQGAHIFSSSPCYRVSNVFDSAPAHALSPHEHLTSSCSSLHVVEAVKLTPFPPLFHSHFPPQSSACHKITTRPVDFPPWPLELLLIFGPIRLPTPLPAPRINPHPPIHHIT